MIVTVAKLKQYVTTDKSDEVLEEMLLALEIAIRQYTNNNFQNRKIRFITNAENGALKTTSPYLKAGDTVQISLSQYNDGLYVIQNGDGTTLDKELYDETQIIVTKVEYPANVQAGAIDIMRWKLKNEEQNYDPDAEKEIQSETLSRHSVTYLQDSTESQLHVDLGVPTKYVSFLKTYKKART